MREGAFLPRPPDYRVSVFRIRALTHENIVALGDKHGPAVNHIFGYGQITVQDVTDAALTVRPAEPPPRHADIVGWARDLDPALSKARHMALAKQLAQRATLHLNQ